MDSTQDLRSHAVGHQRGVQAKHKRNPRLAVTNPELVEAGVMTIRPKSSKRVNNVFRRNQESAVRQASIHRKQDPLGDGRNEEDAAYESSGRDDDAASFQSGSPPDDKFDGRYFDGTAVLEAAVTRAVVKFEDRQTTKLVKDEYDELGDLSDDETGKGHTVDDDDFELL